MRARARATARLVRSRPLHDADAQFPVTALREIRLMRAMDCDNILRVWEVCYAAGAVVLLPLPPLRRSLRAAPAHETACRVMVCGR